MGPQAKAGGKAAGYADGAPAESSVGSSALSQTSVSNREPPGMYDWRRIPWPQVERKLHKLQRRIYRASQRNDGKTVHALQRLLWRSWYAKLLAVRRVTQDNQGKKTAGIDGIACLEPEQRLDLVHSLDLDARPQPIRRVWIPKPGSDEQRPLGIPTLHDRAAQALVTLALEPEWEARFEPNSYGFRPGRSCHDAIEALHASIKHRAKYILDADIAKCFDRINHEALLDKLHTFGRLHRIISGWLKIGVLEGEQLFPTTEGTCQGGVISPLLANVALHGMETAIRDAFPEKKVVNGRRVDWKPNLIRYADDFVICHPDREVILQGQRLIQEWLRPMGLELKPSKTRLCHTLHAQEDPVGFDFLGCTVRQFPVGKYRTGTNSRGTPLGFKTNIKPSQRKVQLHLRRLADLIRHGWSNYYRTVVSAQTFEHCDHQLYQVLRRWGNRRHPNQGRHWIVQKYWHLPGWTFAVPEGLALRKHRQTRIIRHVKVQGNRSPYDGDWGYWAGRMGRYPGLKPRTARCIRRQGSRCSACGLFFRPGDLVEVHHRDYDHANNRPTNLAAMHRHCHHGVHRGKEVNTEGSIHDKDDSAEEPYECESLTYGFEDQPGG
jgi:RNA-directed DNA polymerase